MRDLMHQFSGAGFVAFAFEYACHRGIDHAASTLVGLLRLLDSAGSVSKNRVVLVGHSMGGLVARAAVSLSGGEAFVRKVITLGTPNDGTLQGNWVPRCMAYWGEAIGGANPRGFAAQADSARQLIKSDSPPTLLDRLRRAAGPSGVSYHSISGGYRQLDFGKGYWKNLIINNYLQRRLPVPNDGLVGESSSDLSRPEFAGNAPGCTHNNSYVGYPHANHTFLVNNQEVALCAAACAR
ncbi:alpha/beta hydrolase [Mitsuaria sp. 7]|uniref:lipase family alpha/beta hydrolase n=1 Tax=Mitsuaria sp. 7 TaxID=1658665 RepID=UPI0028732BC3|nr:alpha/beta hydrolase [Mitsuaria sp. 7]